MILEFLIILFGVGQFAVILTSRIFSQKEEDQQDVLLFSTDSETQRTSSCYVFVDADKASFIMGKGSELLKIIGENNNAKLVMTTVNCGDLSTYRRVLIIGGWQEVVFAQRELRLKLHNSEATTTEIIVVPAAAVGILIGKKGDNVKALCRETTARINIDSPSRGDSHASVLIRGTTQAVQKAKKLLEHEVLMWQARRSCRNY